MNAVLIHLVKHVVLLTLGFFVHINYLMENGLILSNAKLIK